MKTGILICLGVLFAGLQVHAFDCDRSISDDCSVQREREINLLLLKALQAKATLLGKAEKVDDNNYRIFYSDAGEANGGCLLISNYATNNLKPLEKRQKEMTSQQIEKYMTLIEWSVSTTFTCGTRGMFGGHLFTASPQGPWVPMFLN